MIIASALFRECFDFPIRSHRVSFVRRWQGGCRNTASPLPGRLLLWIASLVAGVGGASPGGGLPRGADSSLPRPLPSLPGSLRSRTRPRSLSASDKAPPEELPREASCLPSLGSGQPLAPGTGAAPRPSTCLVQGLLLRLGGCLEGHRPDPTAHVPFRVCSRPPLRLLLKEGIRGLFPETLSLVLPLAEPPEPVTRDRQEMERLLVPCPRGLSCLSPRWFS